MLQNTRPRHLAPVRRRRRLVAGAVSGATLMTGLMLVPGSAHAVGTCTTSGPGSYSVEVCLTAPASGATLTGDVTVTATVNVVSGTNPGVQVVNFTLDGIHLLADYEAPYTFTLPTVTYVDGVKQLAVSAQMRPSTSPFNTTPAVISTTFQNGVTTPPVNTNTFTPRQGTTPPAGQSFVVAATGDGASGEANATQVTELVKSWNPNLFLYTGDVYAKGTSTEFHNWYGKNTLWGQFRSITNPTIGNHEYENGVAPGYFDYWDNIPDYYSVDAGGWHVVVLNSTSQFMDDPTRNAAQATWLRNDLAASTRPCTVAVFHHPRYSVGPQGSATRVDEIWRVLAEDGVDLALVGHDHNYQRWTALDANGLASAAGVTQFVLGAGGHGAQSFVSTDSRMLVGYDSTTSPKSFGALRLELNGNGAAYRYVNVENMLLDSGSVQCDTATADTAAPSAPTGLSATPNGSGAVDLAWTAATDDVGVTGYDLLRDGQQIAALGPLPSFRDTTVAAGTTYQYQVRARDAAGNASAVSNTATVTVPSSGATVQFSDGFESGSLAAWTSNNGLTVQQQQVGTGSWAARATSTGSATYAYKQLVEAKNELVYDVKFKILSQSSTTNLLKFRSGTGTSYLGVYVSSSGWLSYRNDVAGVSTTSNRAVSHDVWHTLQVRVLVNGASGQTETWLDGTKVDALSKTESFGTSPIGRVQLGENSTGRTYDVAFDDVLLATPGAPDTTPPSTPTGLSGTAVSPTQVDLSWSASTGEPTGYTVRRDGAVLGTTAAPSWSDTTAQASTTYSYTVSAFDAAGNSSAQSSPLSVTTPSGTPPTQSPSPSPSPSPTPAPSPPPPPPAALPFSDGFESGDLSAWTSSTRMTAQQAEVFSGTYAARATAGANAAFASRQLASEHADVYYRIRFKTLSASGKFHVMRFKTSTGAAMLSVHVTSKGKLAFRNDVSKRTVTSTTDVPKGAWHELQVRLDAATGRTETWLNGAVVTGLTSAQAFSSARVGRLELGDSSSATYDVVFDDVDAATSRIT